MYSSLQKQAAEKATNCFRSRVSFLQNKNSNAFSNLSLDNTSLYLEGLFKSAFYTTSLIETIDAVVVTDQQCDLQSVIFESSCSIIESDSDLLDEFEFYVERATSIEMSAFCAAIHFVAYHKANKTKTVDLLSRLDDLYVNCSYIATIEDCLSKKYGVNVTDGSVGITPNKLDKFHETSTFQISEGRVSDSNTVYIKLFD